MLCSLLTRSFVHISAGSRFPMDVALLKCICARENYIIRFFACSVKNRETLCCLHTFQQTSQVKSIYHKLLLIAQRWKYAVKEFQVLGESVEPVLSASAATEEFTADDER